jgi:CRP-like cAMP-binding protein
MTAFTDTLADVVPYETRTLTRGEALFRQDDPAVAIFAIAMGRLRLERHTPDGRLVLLHTAWPVEAFAETLDPLPLTRCGLPKSGKVFG